jgi:alpha-amylase/alpha-mannosidase (GH57 family)
MSQSAPPTLIIHGHFYQPPRENPWTDEVERQPSADPFHDWNERIAAECYTPNGWARLLDGAGRIKELICNYAAISFDVGATLFRWLDRHAPETGGRIIQADHESRTRFAGHGNALAHPYVHAILPLADPRDRTTLVKWGIAEFRFRFGRDPEGLWLPETAADLATLELLADHGIRFTILAPTQAERSRPPGQEGWIEVGPEGIDPGRPYRCALPGGRSIDLFFFDATLSRAIAFDGLLQSRDSLLTRVMEVAGRSQRPLFILCTDGESYGHHTPGGERALAALLARQPALGDPVISNLGAYLERHPPTHEVAIRKESSWSCAHGIERWRADCGCTTGGREGWRQGWRTHLRSALDLLRDDLQRLFAEQGARYFDDVWVARDDYVRLILDRSAQSLEAYFKAHASRALSAGERTSALRLLEMQRHALLMQTSCGWFYAEISGIEPVQNLRHAARAIDLASFFADSHVEAKFLLGLQAAKSNLQSERDGRTIWEAHVRSARVDLAHLGALYAARALAAPPPEVWPLYGFELHRLVFERRPTQDGTMVAGGVQARSALTLEREEFGFAIRWSHANGMAGHLFPWRGETHLRQRSAEFDTMIDGQSFRDHPEIIPISLKTFSREEQRDVLLALYRAKLDELQKDYDGLDRRTRRLLLDFVDAGLEIPAPLGAPAGFVVARQLEERLCEWLTDGRADAHRELIALADQSRRLELTGNERLREYLSQGLRALIRQLGEDPSPERFARVQAILELADRLACAPATADVIIVMDELIRNHAAPMIERAVRAGSKEPYDLASALLRLAERFGFAIDTWRQRLRPIEERLAADPRLWP